MFAFRCMGKQPLIGGKIAPVIAIKVNCQVITFLSIYKCVGDLKEVRELHRALRDIDKRKTSIVKNGFGTMWLGNLVTKLGGDWEKYRCRGEITDYAIEGNVVTIYQSAAWM